MGSVKRERIEYRAGIVIAAVLLGVSVLLFVMARCVPGFAEWYSSSVYPVLVNTVGRLSGVFPFSVSEALCVLLPFILIADILINRRHLGRFFRHLFIIVSLLVFLYAANCGVNYYREPFVDPEVYSQDSFTVDQLADFCEYASKQLEDNPGGENFAYPNPAAIRESAVSAMEKLGLEYGSLSGYYPQPKKMALISGFFSGMGVSGIYSPFTIEANVNGEMPGMENPFTTCHELSHLKGYMNEGEANYIGWLACVGSEDPAFRRSGWLIAWSYAGSELRRADPERYSEVLQSLPKDAADELNENYEFWASHETKAAEVQDKVNDAYLKSNGQTEGIASYNKLTYLMLMWFYND
ncbi:MAG: DUF3810 domain-containing protein [Mogibacterium sp.]|nr:DUF3810 domain-containing protein [Mogibacterium sp.]